MSINITVGNGQGITQAIKAHLEKQGVKLTNVKLSDWQKVMTLVNQNQQANATAGKDSIFTGGNDVSRIGKNNGDNNWKTDFQVQAGQVMQFDAGIFNKIVAVLTGKAQETPAPDETPDNQPQTPPPLDAKPQGLSQEPDIPDKIEVPADVQRQSTESMIDQLGGKIIQREVNGEMQDIAVVTVDGQKVRRAINEDGTLGDTLAATKTFGKNEYIAGDFPAGTKVLEREVNGQKQQIAVYKDKDGNTQRALVVTDPETGKTTLGENLVTVSTMGKNKYVTESKFNAYVKTMLGLGADEDIPADLKAEYITIGGESSIVIKKDGKVMDSAQLKSFMADYRANTEGNSAFVEAKAQDPISDIPEINSSPQIYNGNSNTEEVKAHNPISDIPEINSAPEIYDGNSNVKDVASNNHKGETREISSDKVKGSYTLAPSDNGDVYRLDTSSLILNNKGEASSFFEMTNKNGNNIYQLSNGLYEFRGLQASGMSSLQSRMDSASQDLSLNNAIYNDLSNKQASGVELADYEKAFMSKHLEDLNNYGLALDKNGNIINIAKDE